MAITISCRQMGYGCDHEISGESFSGILANIQEHAMSEHGIAEDVAHSAEQIDIWRGAIKQSALPGELRTPRSANDLRTP